MTRLVKLTMMPIETGRGSPGIIGTEVAVPVQANVSVSGSAARAVHRPRTTSPVAHSAGSHRMLSGTLPKVTCRPSPHPG